MKLNRPARRQHPETIVALIDVVFFLLVFFMLVGRMDATSPFEVLPPISLAGEDMPAGGVTIAIGQSGELALDGQDVERGALISAILQRLDSQPEIMIRLNAHKETELRHVLPIVAELEQNGATNVVMVVTPNPP